jgi:hypothetical protein
MPSIYQPLAEGNIRLLKLHARQEDSLILCSFSIHDISNEALAPTYVALSYAWGRDNPTHPRRRTPPLVLRRTLFKSVTMKISPPSSFRHWKMFGFKTTPFLRMRQLYDAC